MFPQKGERIDTTADITDIKPAPPAEFTYILGHGSQTYLKLVHLQHFSDTGLLVDAGASGTEFPIETQMFKFAEAGGVYSVSPVTDGTVSFTICPSNSYMNCSPSTAQGSFIPQSVTANGGNYYSTKLNLGNQLGLLYIRAYGSVPDVASTWVPIIVWNVKTTITSVPAIQLNSDGYPIADTEIKYTIEPADYNPATIDVFFYENNEYMGMIQGTRDSAILSQGFAKFYPLNTYAFEVVLNRGTYEVRSERVPLPIAEFRIVSDEDGITPMEGAVTDGAAKLRLQLIAKNNREAFAGLSLKWQLIDPQVNYSPADIRGGFVSGDNIVDSLPVTFNADGIAEVVYRAPESFVRWGTIYESADKDLAERAIQPTVDLENYFKTQSDPFPAIRLKRPPVVLVHGLWGNGNRKSRNYSWKEFEPKFNEKQLYDIVSVDYHETNADRFATNAKAVKEKGIDKALEAVKLQGFASTKVDIIGNSMGGLLPREYCRNNPDDCLRRVRKFVTTDTPHLGSELADILATYQEHKELMDNPISLLPPFTCFGAIDAFITGAYDIAGVDLYSGDMHPIDGGAIDDLATGRWTEYPFNLVASGSWRNFPGLSSQFISHAIVGIATQPEGHHKEIQKLFSKVLYRCNFTLERIFGDQANTNDRIVSQTSQRDNISQPNTIIEGVDHYSVLGDARVINRVKELLDLPNDSLEFTKGK